MSFMGELSDISVADLLYLLALRRQSGKLSISSSGDEVNLFLERGQLILVNSSNMSLRLGRLLVRLGYLDADGLRDALQIQEHSGGGRSLGRVLLDRGFVSDDQLRRCVEEQCVEILARIISADHGVFVYNRGASVPSNTEIVPVNADRIMLEATRRTDEMATLRNLLPNADAPLMLGPDLDAMADTLSDAEVFVAATLQGGAASMTEIASRLSMDEIVLWRTLISPRERGMIVAGTAGAMAAKTLLLPTLS